MRQREIDDLSQDEWVELAVEAEWVLRNIRGIQHIDMMSMFGLDPKTGQPIEPKKKHRRPGEKGQIDPQQWEWMQEEVAKAKQDAVLKPHEIPRDQVPDLDTSQQPYSETAPRKKTSPLRVSLNEMGDLIPGEW